MKKVRATTPDPLVYTTGQGRLCPGCGQAVARCRCRPAATGSPTGDGVVRVRRETSGRKGKGVTVIRGVPLAGAELAQLATDLKRLCGSGGTLKQGVIEIQGDHVDRLIDELKSRGWRVVRAGG